MFQKRSSNKDLQRHQNKALELKTLHLIGKAIDLSCFIKLQQKKKTFGPHIRQPNQSIIKQSMFIDKTEWITIKNIVFSHSRKQNFTTSLIL